jgi:erythronate-4-phosphate dehydrogenase
MSVQAISKFFQLGLDTWKPKGVEGPKNPIIEVNGAELSEHEIIAKAILATYDIRQDDTIFRNNTSLFEQLRGDYPTRREFPAYTIKARNIKRETLEKLKDLGFEVEHA